MDNLDVLVVDDESGIRSGVTRILRNFQVDYPFMDNAISFTVTEASSGEEALEMITTKVPDIILLDNKLPGISGVEVLEYINKNQIKTIVVMITSYASLDVAVKATKNGAFDFVPKPFTPQEIKSSLENITKHLFLSKMTQKMKKEGKQVRFQFLSVLSHEMKAPINAVEGYLQMMQEKQMGDSIEEYSDIIERSLVRMSGMRSLIMDMLDLTRIGSGKKKRDMKSQKIIELAVNAIDTMNPYAIQRDVTIISDIDENIVFYSDADEIGIILNNLISNAIKYNKIGGKVFLTINKKNKDLLIEIKDTGIGLTKDEIPKLFKEFVRIKNPKTKNISGSGLGLSIVKNFVDFYNGEISVSSIPDEGTIFNVLLKNVNDD